MLTTTPEEVFVLYINLQIVMRHVLAMNSCESQAGWSAGTSYKINEYLGVIQNQKETLY